MSAPVKCTECGSWRFPGNVCQAVVNVPVPVFESMRAQLITLAERCAAQAEALARGAEKPKEE